MRKSLTLSASDGAGRRMSAAWRAMTRTVVLVLALAGPGFAAAQERQPAERLDALRRRLPEVPTDIRKRHEWENLNFHLAKAQFILQSYPMTPDVRLTLDGVLEAAAECEAGLAGGGPPPVRAGSREEAYYCDLDASFQPFVRYLPQSVPAGRKLPMLVFLHGYSPALNIANWASMPTNMPALAESMGFCVLMPFGRSNTDYQGIGERDVMCAIAEMQERYAIDAERIVLAGHSMGGMGVWTVGARNPDAFAGLLVVAGRGDYYFWKRLERDRVPSYKRALIDVDSGQSLLGNLSGLPVFVTHGAADTLISIQEGRHMVEAVRGVNPRISYLEFEDGHHWIVERSLATPEAQAWLKERWRKGRERVPAGVRSPGTQATGSSREPALQASACGGPIKAAFLSPFVFVRAAPEADPPGRERFSAAALDWYRYAKAPPRMADEAKADPARLAGLNVFLFGEPETSAGIRAALKESPVRVEGDHFVVGTRRFPRKGNGLFVVRRNPWNGRRLVVVQCGLPWGAGLPENHKYDFLPDYIVYSGDRDSDGSNTALCAGFFDADWKLDPARMYPPGDEVPARARGAREPG